MRYEQVPDLSPEDQARERRILLFLGLADRLPAHSKVRRHWVRAAQREMAQRSPYARRVAAEGAC